jgi:hypothetical protein
MYLKTLASLLLSFTLLISCSDSTDNRTTNSYFILSQINSLQCDIYLLNNGLQEVKKEFLTSLDTLIKTNRCETSLIKQLKTNEENVTELTELIDIQVKNIADILIFKTINKKEYNSVILVDSVNLINEFKVRKSIKKIDTIFSQTQKVVKLFRKTIDTDCNFKNDWLHYSYKIQFGLENGEIKPSFSLYLKSPKYKWEQYIDLLTLKKNILNHQLILLRSLQKK